MDKHAIATLLQIFYNQVNNAFCEDSVEELKDNGLIEYKNENQIYGPGGYHASDMRITEKGEFYLNSLVNVPMPIRVWSTPK